MHYKKLRITVFILFVHMAMGFSQNQFPTDSDVIIDGQSVVLKMPSTSGGWARGFFFKDPTGTDPWLGFGLKGGSTDPEAFFIAHGASPWNSGNGLYIQDTGNVGIGTSNPQRLLHIEQAEDPSTDSALLISEPNNSQQITLHLADNANGEYGYLGLGGETRLRGNGEPSVFEGNVGIGTTDPGTWKLAVNGKIRATEIKVETGWADYVFEKDYPLPPLEAVEKHIVEKGHLMNIPSAEEVAANGIELGEMNRLLLEKIEELTLYVIQLKTENDKLREDVDKILKTAEKQN